MSLIWGHRRRSHPNATALGFDHDGLSAMVVLIERVALTCSQYCTVSLQFFAEKRLHILRNCSRQSNFAAVPGKTQIWRFFYGSACWNFSKPEELAFVASG